MDIRIFLKIFLVSSIFTLAACSGGGGDESVPVENEAGGIWYGTVATANNTSYEAVGFINESGELRFLRNDGEQTVGKIQTQGSSGDMIYTASVTAYAPIGETYVLNGKASIALKVSGVLVPKDSFSGDITYNGMPSSTVSFNYDNAYERGSSLETISGIYSLTDDQGITETYTITSDGSITGSDTTGCVSNGTIDAIDPNFNMYRIRLTISSCGIVNGSYSGLAALLDDGGSENDTLGFSLTGPNLVFSGVIPRVATANSAPLASAGTDQNIATGTVVTLSGVTSSDADGDLLSYSWSLTSVPTGSSAALNNTAAVSPTFTADVDGSYIAQLIVSDGSEHSSPDTVTIIASTTNSAPVANAGTNQNIATGTVVTLSGVTSSDADGDSLSYSWSLTSVPTGSAAALNNSSAVSPTFTADVDGSYIAQLIVSDGTENSSPDTVTIIASTANSAPVANAGTDQNIISATIVNLDGSASSDADGDGISYDWAFISKPAGSTSSLENSQAVNPSFTADLEGSYVLSLIVNDGIDFSIVDNVLINVSGEDTFSDTSPPQLVSWSISPTSVDTSLQEKIVTIDFRVTDDQSGTVMPNISATHTATSQSTGFAQISLISGDNIDGTYRASLSVPQGSAPGTWRVSLFPLRDNQGNSGVFGPSAEFTSTFTVTEGEMVADTSPPQLVSWSISPASVDTSLQEKIVTIDFRVTDDQSGTVMPNISATHTATSQSTGFAQISLISGDNIDGTYRASLSVPQGSAPGTWRVSLFPLRDNQGNSGVFGPSAEFTSTFTVNSDGQHINDTPIANAGPDQNIATGTVVSLNGSSSSDADGDTLTYQWSLTSVPTGSAAALNNTSAVSPTFTADLDGSYIAQLIVSDGTENSSSDTVTIIASTANSAPVANAGIDQNIATGTVVSLNGSASSDADGDMLTYQWSLTSVPTGSAAVLNNTAAVSPTFTADVDGSFIAQLIVSDGTENSSSDTVTIIASTANSAPVASAGTNQNIATGTVVSLNGSASSDADGDMLTYQWSLTSVPTGSAAVLNNTAAVSPTFTADVDGSYIAQLIVSDGTENSSPDTLTIIASTANSAPVANAGIDQSIISATIVNLDGSASSDADGDGISYDWAFISKPAGSNASLDNSQAVNPSFAADLEGSYIIALVVNDGLESSVSDTVQVEALQPRVKLYRESGDFFGSTFNEVSLPYSSSSSVSTNVAGIPTPTTYSLATFKLLAQGGTFTVTNLNATDSNSSVAPYFTVIADNYELNDGVEVEFELISPLTRGATASLNFSFEIQETGETFSASYTFTSN